MRATLFGIGVGPGDPELITVKGVRLLKAAPVVCFPKGKESAAGYAESIVRCYVDPTRQELLPLSFPMSLDEPTLRASWAAAGEAVASHLRQGRDVVFVTEGDPLFFSTFIYLADDVRRRLPESRTEIVPGVSSILACAAAAGTPLAVAGETVIVADAPHALHHLDALLDSGHVVLLMKVAGCLPAVVEILERRGLRESAVLVERCGTAEQRIIAGADLAGCGRPGYLSTLIVFRPEREGGPEGAPLWRIA